MFKKFPLTFVVTSAIVAIPALSLTSCDSGPVETGVVDLGNRFDIAQLQASPNATAEMPAFLLEGDSFQHAVTATDFNTQEYTRGFEVGDNPIIVNSIGQISNAEGESVTDNVNYIYDPDTASFSLTEQNSFPADFEEEEIRDSFNEQLAAIEESLFVTGGSLAEALDNDFTSAASTRVIEAAIESIGLIGSDQGIVFQYSAGNEFGVTFTGASARIARTIEYIPQSTNAELLSNGQITGTVIITDTIVDVVVLNPNGEGEEDEAEDLIFSLAPGIIEGVDINDQGTSNDLATGYRELFEATIIHTGTFTYSLDGGSTF